MRRLIRIGLPLVVVTGIFFFAFPRIADFSQVWARFQEMTWVELGSLAFMASWNLAAYWFVMMAALPGSNVWQSMKVNQASTAVANAIPGGGALGIGVTYTMYGEDGFTAAETTLAILISGIWNNFVKLGMPVVALALLVLTGDAGSAVLLAAIAGVVGLLVSIGLFWAVLSSERLAARVGARVGKVINVLRKLARKNSNLDFAHATVRFRRDAIGLIQTRWVRLTVSTLVSHLSLYFVMFLALRHVGVTEAEVSWVEALAAFAFVRLVSALPITPGGLGVVELGLTAALVAAGGKEAGVVAGVLVYRALTFLVPIPIGLFLYLNWRKGSQGRRARLEEAAAQARRAYLQSTSGDL